MTAIHTYHGKRHQQQQRSRSNKRSTNRAMAQEGKGNTTGHNTTCNGAMIHYLESKNVWETQRCKLNWPPRTSNKNNPPKHSKCLWSYMEMSLFYKYKQSGTIIQTHTAYVILERVYEYLLICTSKLNNDVLLNIGAGHVSSFWLQIHWKRLNITISRTPNNDTHWYTYTW